MTHEYSIRANSYYETNIYYIIIQNLIIVGGFR